MSNQFFELWEDGVADNFDEMVGLLKRHLARTYPHLEEDTDRVAVLKRDFESDLPNRVVAEAVGCDIRLCRDVRWLGDQVVDTRGGRDSKSIAPSRRNKIRRECNNQCVRCGKSPAELEDDLQLHHIIPLSQGGFNFDSNLTYLCPDCHIEAHAGDFSTRRTAYRDKEEFWNEFVKNDVRDE